MSNILKPKEPPYDGTIARILDRYPQRGGVLLSLFKTFANSERFLKKGVGNFLDPESPLTLRQRELVILRTTANLSCEYEWGVHVAAYADEAGLTREQVAATRGAKSDDAVWTEHDRLILKGIDELTRSGKISDVSYEQWSQTFSFDEQLEMLAVCGNYHTISFVANTARLAPEPFGARFP